MSVTFLSTTCSTTCLQHINAPPSILLFPLNPASSSIHLPYPQSLCSPTIYRPTYLALAPATVINTRAKSNLEEKGFAWPMGCSPSSREAKVRAQGTNLGTRTEARTGEEYRSLVCSPWLALSYTAQDHLPRSSTAHHK